jgi:hypothetical protein
MQEMPDFIGWRKRESNVQVSKAQSRGAADFGHRQVITKIVFFEEPKTPVLNNS